MKNNEKGITLVELLATIVIASFVMGTIYAVILFAMEYSSVETSKTKLQQEANYIITELQRIHRKGDCYSLTTDEDQVVVKDCISTDNDSVISTGYIYKLDYGKDGEEIDPLKENLNLKSFIIQDPKNKDLKVEISTVISRYKNNNKSGEEG